MRRLLTICLSLVLAVGAAPAAAADTIDAIATDYAELALSGYLLNNPAIKVDASLDGLLSDAVREKRDARRIGLEADGLVERLDALAPSSDALLEMRRRSLRARLTSLGVNMLPRGTKLPVAEDVKRRFGFDPQFVALTEYDEALTRFDKAMPGSGTLAARIDAMRKSAAVAPDKIEPVFRAALAECRRRTIARLELPPETVNVEFVDDNLTPALAAYEGKARTTVRISKTIPTDVDRLLQHACHEAYPGHHAHYVAMDTELFRKRGWVEYGVGIDSDPIFPVAEAIAEYGVGLAFPVEERIAFERDVLFPLAGLTMGNADQWRAFHTARPELLGASATIARDLLSGAIDQATAERLLMRYRLQTPEAAAQTLKMISAFGSFLIASDFGWYAVDRAMRGKPVDEQWRLIAQMQREPMLLEDISRLATAQKP